jgi:hypothetical protein
MKRTRKQIVILSENIEKSGTMTEQTPCKRVNVQHRSLRWGGVGTLILTILVVCNRVTGGGGDSYLLQQSR